MKEEQNVSLYIRTSRLKCAMLKAAKLKMRLQKKYRGFLLPLPQIKRVVHFAQAVLVGVNTPFYVKLIGELQDKINEH